MATRFELVLMGDDESVLRSAGEAAIERIEEAHRTFTRFEESSLVAHLRRVAPRPVRVDAETISLFAEAIEVTAGSDGAFAVVTTAGPLLGAALALDPTASTVALGGPQVAIDLGAIAKGFAVDQAGRVLRDAGVAAAFVHGGTSSALGIGCCPGRPGWRVALEGTPPGPTIELEDAALSVSGNLTRDHLRDPRVGRPLARGRRAVVVGPKASLADGWSTAAAVLGRRPPGMGPEWRLGLQEENRPWRWLA